MKMLSKLGRLHIEDSGSLLCDVLIRENLNERIDIVDFSTGTTRIMKESDKNNSKQEFIR